MGRAKPIQGRGAATSGARRPARGGRARVRVIANEAPARAPEDGGGADPAPATSPRVRVRMYRTGLGDCFLVTFQPGTAAEAHLLVDMGSIGKGDAGIDMDEVAADIAEATKGRGLSAVVATHEHADHLSGFAALAAAGVRAGEAWLAWTEDLSDPLAKELERYEGDLAAIAEHALARLEAEELGAYGEMTVAGLRDLRRFAGFPADVDTSLAATGGLKANLQRMAESVRDLAGRRARFCSPGDVIEPAWAPGVRFYVLGPPRDARAIRELGEHGSPDLYELAYAVGEPLAPADVAAWEPFDREYMYRQDEAAALGALVSAYEAEPWRKVDEVTATAAAELALQLDSYTNNTSLVLAIEVGEEVLLFPGDAQLGSWLTWGAVEFTVREGGQERKVRGEELLRRTTFYKVGHHASHNATAKPVLELMGARGLTAFIPLDERVARNRSWPMPARSLRQRLLEKTRGRVLKSDEEADRVQLPGVTVTKRYVETILPLADVRTVQAGGDGDAAEAVGAA